MICLLFYSKEERTDRRAHAGNVLDFARIANQGYNGRRARRSNGREDRTYADKRRKFSDERSNGREDRTYADKRRKFSDEFMSGKYSIQRKERVQRENEGEYSYARGKEMSHFSNRGMSQHSYGGSGSISMDSPVQKYKEMKMIGYKCDEKAKSKNMPEYISTPSPAKYSCHQDSGSSSSSSSSSTSEGKSKEML